MEVTPLTRKITAALLVVLMASPAYAIRARKVSTTAYPNCFKMVDSADHVTAKTGLTITCTRSKNGGSFASCSGSVSEVANGIYCIAGNATDRDTLGPLIFHATGTAADPNDFEIEVVTYDPFIYPDTSATLAAVTTVSTTTTATTCTNVTNAPTAGDFTATMKTSLNDSTPACSSVSGAVGSVTGNVGGSVAGSVGSVTGLTTTTIADQVWDEATAGHQAAGSTGLALTSGSAPSAADIWTYGTRTLTACSFCISAASFWSYDVRTLTTISGTTNILSPTGTVGTLRLTRNDSYYLADGPIPTFTREGWPDLTDATEVKLTVRRRPPVAADEDPVLLSVTDREASRIVGAEEQTVAFEMTVEDTADLVPGQNAGKYDIQVTWADGHERTIETGLVTVTEDQTRPE